MLFIYIFTYFLETTYYRHSEGSTPLVFLRPWVLDWQRIESGPTVLKSGTQPTELFTNQSAVDFPVFCIRPRPHVSVSIRELFFFFNEDFSLPHTRKRRFWPPKTQVFEHGPLSGDFWKCRLVVFVWTDQNENSELFEYDGVIHHFRVDGQKKRFG